MAYYGSRLSFGHHRNLSSVTIPNNVLVGEDGDFSGRFSVMMNYNYGMDETYVYDGPPDPDTWIIPGHYEYTSNLEKILYEEDFKMHQDAYWSSNSYYNTENKPNISLTPKLVFDNCPPLKHINIGGGYSINLVH